MLILNLLGVFLLVFRSLDSICYCAIRFGLFFSVGYPVHYNPPIYCFVSCIFSGSGVDSRGGQLQIAGVVVGNWGPNTNQQQQQNTRGPQSYGAGRSNSNNNMQAPPHVMNVGPRR